jgi:hypothetical protein
MAGDFWLLLPRGERGRERERERGRESERERRKEREREREGEGENIVSDRGERPSQSYVDIGMLRNRASRLLLCLSPCRSIYLSLTL